MKCGHRPFTSLALLILLILSSNGLSRAAERSQESESYEQLMARCRKLAVSGERTEAIQQLRRYLNDHDNSDVRVLLGQVLSWEGQYDDARTELERVLATSRDHGDARPALIHVELWSGHAERASELIDDSLRRAPQSTGLMILKAKVLAARNEPVQARDVVNRLLQLDPGNNEALQLRKALYEQGRKLQSNAAQSIEWFNDGTKPWHETQITLKQDSSTGPLIARFSQADRFSMTSRQSEIEYYPHLRPGTYMYLGAGYSSDRRLYPRLRGGAEIFQSVGHGFELSGGIRSMLFSEKVNIYTGSVGKYRGNWYHSLRTFLTPGDSGVSKSFQFQTRRYFGSSGTDYIGFRLGRGSSPVEIRSVQDIAILHLNSVGVEVYHRISRSLTLGVRSGTSREDRLYRSRLLHSYADISLFFRL